MSYKFPNNLSLALQANLTYIWPIPSKWDSKVFYDRVLVKVSARFSANALFAMTIFNY
jgi:hypothetical protein